MPTMSEAAVHDETGDPPAADLRGVSASSRIATIAWR